MSEEKVKEKLEYLAMDYLADSIEKLDFSKKEIVIDFAEAVDYALKKSGRKKLLVLPATIKKEVKTIKSAFRNNLPTDFFSLESNNGYPKITIETKPKQNPEVYTKKSLPEYIIDIIIKLSKTEPKTNSMFLFGKSLVGKRRESASELYKKMSESKNLKNAIAKAKAEAEAKAKAEAEAKAKAEAEAKAKAEAEAKKIKKEAEKSISEFAILKKESDKNYHDLTTLGDKYFACKEKLKKTREQKDIDKLEEEMEDLHKKIQDTYAKYNESSNKQKEFSQQLNEEIKNIKQARKDLPQDMQDLFDETKYETELKTSTSELKKNEQVINNKVKPLLALTWDGPKKGPRIEDVD